MASRLLVFSIIYLTLLCSISTNGQKPLFGDEDNNDDDEGHLKVPFVSQDVVAANLSTVDLFCWLPTPVTGAVFEWLKDGQMVEGEGFKTWADGRLTLSKLDRRKHQGNYTCRVGDDIGKVFSPHVQVLIADLSQPVVTSTEHSYMQGENIRLVCEVTSIPPPTFRWYKDQQLIQSSNSRVSMLPSGVLHVYIVEAGDSGNYSCQVQNSVLNTSLTSQQFQVNVLNGGNRPSVKIIQGPQGIRLPLHSQLDWECLATGLPNPTITWFQEEFSSGKDVRVSSPDIELRGATLHISYVQQNHHTYYWCQASSGGMRVNSSKAALKVSEPPYYLGDTNTNIHRSKGFSVSITCDFEAYPHAEISWYHNGDKIESNDRIDIMEEGSRLQIGELQPSDEGYYQCAGTNEAGTAYGLHRITTLSTTRGYNIPTRVST